MTHCVCKMALKCPKVPPKDKHLDWTSFYWNASQTLITSWIDMKFQPHKLD